MAIITLVITGRAMIREVLMSDTLIARVAERTPLRGTVRTVHVAAAKPIWLQLAAPVTSIALQQTNNRPERVTHARDII